MIEEDKLVELTEDCCENYGMLSRLFRVEIDRPLLEDLVGSPEAEPIGNQDFDQGYARLRAHLDQIEDLDRGKSVLAIDYCLTFLGYGVDPAKADENGRNAAYPYESIYTKKVKTLGGEYSADVKALYQAQGFKPEKGREALAADHIAGELEFMQFLASMELSALKGEGPLEARKARELSCSFAKDHLLNWIGEFQQAVEGFSETEFYKGLVQMTKGWLAYDVAYLEDLLGEEDPA